MTKHAVIIVCWICVIATGGFLRFDDLAKRPFHADEATGARIAAKRMEAQGGAFDPKHYHGPLLADLAIPLSRAKGENTWQTMSKSTLRLIPAAAGFLLILAPLCLRRRFGDVPVMAAGAFIATSPLLVYYSRMFIHESLLVLFGMAVLISLHGKPRPVVTGILIGLMFATKESFAISIIAWTAAACLVAFENRKSLDPEKLRAVFIALGIAAMVAALIAALFYTHGFRHPRGALDAVRTFFVYETVDGHDKPFGYYLHLLTVPVKSGGVWWFGTPVCLLAIAAVVLSFRNSAEQARSRPWIRFLAWSALGHFIIYSMIAYKTPWLACLPWAHVCLLAGFAFAGPASRFTVPLGLIAAFGLITQVSQSRQAIGRLASDDRNPFAYVPTRADVERLEVWLADLRRGAADASLDTIAVVGADYWPLPWYLRSFAKAGYWKTPPEGIKEMPIVLSMPDTAEELTVSLADSHVALDRGLRAGVPLKVFVRNDVWKQWMENAR